MLNFLRKKIINSRDPKIISRVNNINLNNKKNLKYYINRFGSKNKNKIFYVIQRSPGGGLFSNLLFVIHHLYIAKKFNFIPAVDMENYPTIYNEKNSIRKSFNAWDYYFEPVSKYSLKEIYKSRNVIITTKETNKNIFFDGYKNLLKDHRNIFLKNIKIKKFLIKEKDIFFNKHFKNHNVLGVHFRGTDYKTMERHPLPATNKQIIENINLLIKKFKFNKIFLVTEEKNYYKDLTKRYSNVINFSKIITNKKQLFFEDNIKNIRYKIGKENIINMLLLSETKHILCTESNLSEAAIYFSKKKIKVTKIFNGYNSKNIFIAQFKWYIKKNLPKFFGGI
jgi:hypothetical protein